MIIKRCPGDLKTIIHDLLKNAVNLSCYDPNFIYQEDDEEMSESLADNGWGSDYDDEN